MDGYIYVISLPHRIFKNFSSATPPSRKLTDKKVVEKFYN
jgi:hypothetical protein